MFYNPAVAQVVLFPIMKAVIVTGDLSPAMPFTHAVHLSYFC